MTFTNPDRFGLHRVIEPAGVLPQGAWKINNAMTMADNELLIEVSTLNIDSASFTQIKKAVGADEEKVSAEILRIVGERGKMHNPVTGSGGMLIGKVKAIGKNFQNPTAVKIGDKIASLVSLSLTPLMINAIKKVHINSDQVEVNAEAILFSSGLFTVLPADIPEKVALAILDVAGAPAQVARLVKAGQTVVVIGAGGKSGTLCLYEAKKAAHKNVGNGNTGCVIGISPFAHECEAMRAQGFADVVLQVDANDAVAVMNAVSTATGGAMADVTINCVNITDTEMASILSTKDRGTIYFFSMATSFTKAALGAEGVGKDVDMLVGNGYAVGHAEYALSLLRESALIRKLFEEKYS